MSGPINPIQFLEHRIATLTARNSVLISCLDEIYLLVSDNQDIEDVPNGDGRTRPNLQMRIARLIEEANQ